MPTFLQRLKNLFNKNEPKPKPEPVQELSQCQHFIQLTQRRCDKAVWKDGEQYCVTHDIAHLYLTAPQILLEGLEPYGEPGVILGFVDLRVAIGQLMNLTDDEIGALLKRKYAGDQTHLIPWVRQLIDSSMPTKNDRPL